MDRQSKLDTPFSVVVRGFQVMMHEVTHGLKDSKVDSMKKLYARIDELTFAPEVGIIGRKESRKGFIREQYEEATNRKKKQKLLTRPDTSQLLGEVVHYDWQREMPARFVDSFIELSFMNDVWAQAFAEAAPEMFADFTARLNRTLADKKLLSEKTELRDKRKGHMADARNKIVEGRKDINSYKYAYDAQHGFFFDIMPKYEKNAKEIYGSFNKIYREGKAKQTRAENLRNNTRQLTDFTPKYKVTGFRGHAKGKAMEKSGAYLETQGFEVIYLPVVGKDGKIRLELIAEARDSKVFDEIIEVREQVGMQEGKKIVPVGKLKEILDKAKRVTNKILSTWVRILNL